VLTDDELRAVVAAAKVMGPPYGSLVQFILLTATRLAEAANMNRAELNGIEWTIPARRYKTGLDHVVPLSGAALELLIPIGIGRKGWIFTNDGEKPISGFTYFKSKLDKLMLAELRKVDPDAKPPPRWTTHDLRRTARSLMSRAGVSADHAERCLGHVIGGVRGTYDRHAYFDEKKHAFEALAAQMDRIVNPQPNVVPMRAV
jgi:integrase